MNRNYKLLFIIMLCSKVLNSSSNLKSFLDVENRNLGAKIDYASFACSAYGQYAQAVLEKDSERSNAAWQEAQEYQNRYNQVPTPLAEHLFYGGFGYWLYNRLAYPATKKNWGKAKKAIVGASIAAWLYKRTFDSESSCLQREFLDTCQETSMSDSDLSD